jgi:hypothetical protein
MISEIYVREDLLAIDLDQGKVGLRVAADYLCHVSCTAIGCDLDGKLFQRRSGLERQDIIVALGIHARRLCGVVNFDPH